MINRNVKKCILQYILCITLILLTAVLIKKPVYADDYGLEVHYIDVGQGDAALVICEGQAMLIDGGSSDNSQLMYNYLKNQGISHLKYVIATHADEDHIGGLAGALNYADVDAAYCSTLENDSNSFRNFLKYLGDTTLERPKSGTLLTLGSAEITVLGPLYEMEGSNNNSIVLRLVYGNTSFLFMGDAEFEEEESILNAGYSITSDVIKIAHHGSSSSTTQEFIEEVSPEIAIISVGRDNDYGHPKQEILSRLKDINVALFRTDLNGCIICLSDGDTITTLVSKNQEADVYNQRTNESDLKADKEDHTYILNQYSKIIHTINCINVSKMSDRNKLEVTGSRESILAEYEEYRPCGNCNAMY